MATGMKVWLGGVAVAIGIVALLAIPPRTFLPTFPTPSPELRREREVGTELRVAHGVLVTMRWADSLSALTVDGAANRAAGGLVVAAPPSEAVTPAGVEEWRAILAAELDALEPRDHTVTVGAYWQPVTHGLLPDVPRPVLGDGAQTYVGERDGIAYCLQVRPFLSAPDNALLRRTAGLGACRLYAKHGLPSAPIAAWLEAGGLAYALDDADSERPPAASMFFAPDLPLGFARPFGAHPLIARCLGGDHEGCAAVVAEPARLLVREQARIAAQSPVAHIDYRWDAPFFAVGRRLLDALEREFGAEAFSRFWRSPEPVPVAFEAAFGLELGAWVSGWAEREVGRFDAGPGLPRGHLLWSLIALTVLAAVASAIAWRRRVA